MMSIDEEKDITVRVINKEYERVLSNPGNLIVSESIQDLIDLALPSSESSADDQRAASPFKIVALDPDGLPVAVSGELIRMSSDLGLYNITIEAMNIKKEFLSLLELAAADSPTTLFISGVYDLEISATKIKWSLERSSPYNYQLNIGFRSEHVIF
jgi:hypothetical protein